MVVLIREKRRSNNNIDITEVVYRGSPYPSPEQIKHADWLDKFLSIKLEEIANELMEMNLLSKKRGDVDRWYQLGKKIADIVDDPKIILPELKQQDLYIWIAIEQNCPEELFQSMKIGERSITRTKRNHYRFCYLISKFPLPIVKCHNWRNWRTIFESPALIEDDRIITWLNEKLKKNPNIDLREISKSLRRGLKDFYTQVLSDNELFCYLDEISIDLIE